METSPPAFTLEIVEGPLAGKKICKENGTRFLVSRKKNKDVQIKDPSVSETHAEFVYEDGAWQLRDLGSSNGTMVNGTDVKGAQ